MREQPQLEETLRSAVGDFVHGATSIEEKGARANLASLLRATQDLPLTRLALWETTIRDALPLPWRGRPGALSAGWPAWVPFAPKPGKAPRLVWLDLASRDGHAREGALRTLVGPAPNRFFFALAARRLNDWVPQVRDAAREALPALARSSDPEHVVDTLCAVLPAWSAWGRVQEQDRQAMLALAATARVAESLRRRLTCAPAGPMATVLSQCLRTAVLDQYLAQIAANAVQPTVRATAHRALLLGQATWLAGYQWLWTDPVSYHRGVRRIIDHRALETSRPLHDSLELAAADRSPIVRNVAAEALIREADKLGDAARPLAQRLAADRSPRVAERGAFVLKQLAASGL